MRHHLSGLLTSVAMLVGASSLASAADLPSRVAPLAVPVAVPLFTWTGFYVGVNAGAGFGADSGEETNTIFVTPNSIIGSEGSNGTLTFGQGGGSNDDEAFFVGGAQVGFNYQFTPGSGFVVGVEADIQYVDLNRDDRFNQFAFGPSTAYSFVPATPLTRGLAFAPPQAAIVGGFGNGGSGLDYFGTVRGRIGYAFDRVMVYATGGLAYGEGDNESNNFFGVNTFGFQNDRDDFRVGYTVGGGVEYAFTNNITLKLEGLYVNLEEDEDDNAFFGAGAFGGFGTVGVYDRASNILTLTNNATKNELEFGLVRAGINFKFSSF